MVRPTFKRGLSRNMLADMTAGRRLLIVGLPAVLTAAALLLSFAVASSAKPRTCRAEGSITLRKSSHARVYRIGRFGKVYGVLYSKDTRYLLTPTLSDCDPDLTGPDRPIRLAGRYVGYTIHNCSEGGGDSDEVYVRDLRTGEGLVQTSASRTLRLGDGGRIATDMELKANGSVAWIVHRLPPDPADRPRRRGVQSDRTIAKGPRTTSKLLDAGNRIALNSEADPRGLHLLPGRRRRPHDGSPEVTALPAGRGLPADEEFNSCSAPTTRQGV